MPDLLWVGGYACLLGFLSDVDVVGRLHEARHRLEDADQFQPVCREACFLEELSARTCFRVLVRFEDSAW
nr:hypothetical protein [Nocardia amamiensis]